MNGGGGYSGRGWQLSGEVTPNRSTHELELLFVFALANIGSSKFAKELTLWRKDDTPKVSWKLHVRGTKKIRF